jgi:hypothetical protein
LGLRLRFGQQKIFLMGHSGGSFLGIQAAARAPDRYLANIGVGQTVDQSRSERMAYDYMLEQCVKSGKGKMARKLNVSRYLHERHHAGVPQPTRQGDAHSRHRDDTFHEVGVCGDFPAIAEIPRVHAQRKNQPVARQGSLRSQHLVGHPASNRSEQGLTGAQAASVLPRGCLRLHVLIFFSETIHDESEGSCERILLVLRVCPQSGILGTRASARYYAP